MATGQEPEETVVRALHRAAATERAPAGLRERLERQRLEGGRARGRAGSGWGLPVLGARAWSGMAAVLVAVVVAAALLIPGATPGSPSVAAAAAVATRGSTSMAPQPDPTDTYLLTARVEDLHFPNWEAQNQGWVAIGARTDRLGNRDITTVYYKHDHWTIAYSIVSSPELASTGLGSFMQHGRTVFAWRQSGHTCLLSGVGMKAATLQRLVSQTARSAT